MPLLAAFLQRRDGPDALAVSLARAGVTADTAKLIRRWLNAAGRAEPGLNKALDKIIGAQAPPRGLGLVVGVSEVTLLADRGG